MLSPSNLLILTRITLTKLNFSLCICFTKLQNDVLVTRLWMCFKIIEVSSPITTMCLRQFKVIAPIYVHCKFPMQSMLCLKHIVPIGLFSCRVLMAVNIHLRFPLLFLVKLIIIAYKMYN